MASRPDLMLPANEIAHQEPCYGLSDPMCSSFGPRQASTFNTVTAAFHDYAQKQPEAIAARDFSRQKLRIITYGELSSRASRLAVQLRAFGVQPGDHVPLVVNRSIEMLVGIIAVLLCGAQYVPLDGGVVSDTTLSYVLKQSKSSVALSIASTDYRLSSLEDVACEAIVIEDPDAQLRYIQDSYPLESFVDLASEDLGCYIIYTSGTTGTPKGVDVKHSNVTNLICLSPGNLGIKPGTMVGSVLNIGFDTGAWKFLPSAKYPNIKVVATAGEPSEQKLADLWATHCTYYNCYGPTETTIVNTMWKHVPGFSLSIGVPTPNNSLYVLDENLNPVPVGQSGVMWAGGLGITRGYIGLPEQTAAKYKLDTFMNDGSMMYNTGDLGRWRPDGVLDIFVRVDDQVKVKDLRVELDGISASISSCTGVKRAIALMVGRDIHGFLEPATISLDAIRQKLALKQPYYARPSKLHLLDTLPETTNGKLDKKLLRSMAEFSRLRQEKSMASGAFSSNVSTSGSDTFDNLKKATVMEPMVLSVDTNLTVEIPEKILRKPFRGLVHRVFIVYRLLFTLVGLGNTGALIAIFATGADRQWCGTMSAINLIIAVLIRQDFVINTLYTICCSVPKSWPLLIRKRCAKIYHLGGVHSSAAVCAGIWLLVFNIINITCQLTPITCTPEVPPQSLSVAVISWILAAGFLVVAGFSLPSFRKRNHDLFEKVHRFIGWTILGLFWVQIILSTIDSKPPDESLGYACFRIPSFWLLILATCLITMSWLSLRKVPVEVEALPPHAVRLHFEYTVPINGTFIRLSRKPVLEWHSFAAIPAPQAVNGRSKGYSLIVSDAGNWTKDCIHNPPTYFWVRSVPTCGVLCVAMLFRSVVLIATGSGIGPHLGHIQIPSCPTKLIWSAPNPEKTFGQPILDAIYDKIPDAIIHDTKTLGRPDLVKMGYNLARSAGTEAVIVIANEKVTKKVVYGLGARGISVYGAIWDS